VAAVVTCTSSFTAEIELVPNDKCLECHGMDDLSKTNAGGETISLFTDEAIFHASIHGTTSCIDCHRDLATAWEHPDDGHTPARVDCAQCHERQSATYRASAHGMAIEKGVVAAATCIDCHGTHDVRSVNLPESRVHFARLIESCGECHAEQASDFAESVHGVALAKGEREAPTCIDCHAEHQIETLRSAAPLKIAEQVCAKCHASERLNTRLRLPARLVDTFFESYHGLAAKGGLTAAANCASCHGWHKVLPSSDPRSTIHKNHLVGTCGKCHPGIGENFASGKVHMDDTVDGEVGSVVNRWVRRAYVMLIISVVGLLGLHNGAAWLQKARAAYRASNRTIVRMDRAQRSQHLVLVLSFILLALTGFALRFPDSWLSWAFGNEAVRRWVHRFAGVVLLGVGAWHIGYVILSARGRQLWRDLQFRPHDWNDLKANAKHLAGRSTDRPRFGRFGYPEKIEYWAVVWGTIIMGVTGLAIWLKVDVTQFLPRWVVDVATTIHYYEAILACLAIVVWHFYHVFLDPGVYPGNFAWLDGKVSAEWQNHEHPLDPVSESKVEPSLTSSEGNGHQGNGTIGATTRSDGVAVGSPQDR
jgi:formate dehydrogenase gamma subunit